MRTHKGQHPRMGAVDVVPFVPVKNVTMKEAVEPTMTSEQMRLFRKRLFTRIVPTVKDIGLWGERVQKAFADMGAIEFADVDSEALLEHDNRVAEEFDAKRFVTDALAKP